MAMHDPIQPSGDHSSNAELLWLLGQPELEDYLDFVKRKVVGGDTLPPKALADEWRTANDLFHDLELAEAGLADSIECKPLPDEAAAAEEELRADRYFRAAYDTLPASIEMVELDKL